MKYLKLFENFEPYDPYELMITPPNKKGEMLFKEIEKRDKANLNLVNDLIALGANLDWQNNNYGSTALHRCVYNNHSRILRMLIDAGADVNIQNNNGWTALYTSVYKNHPELLRMLLDAGADVNVQDDYGYTALHYCAVMNRPEILRILLDAGADKTISNSRGELPYELATSQELKELLQP